MKTVLNAFDLARRGSSPALAIEIVRLAMILMGWLGVSSLADADNSARPNIVVILVDDLRWDDIGCAGHPFVRTPHIDRLAREGARFRNAFCNTPLCSPARACLLTGLYTHQHGILDNTDRSERSHQLQTFPRDLRAAGYETAYIGKWHMGNDDSARPGFDYWVSMKGQGTSFNPVLNVNGRDIKQQGHTTDALNQHAAEFAGQKREKPFCLYVAHKALHPELRQFDDGSISDPSAARFLPARRHEKLYTDDPIPRRLNILDDINDKPALARVIDGLPPLSEKTGTSDKTIRDRLRMLAAVDEGVGMLLELLAAGSKLNDTVFIFTSDHGYWYGEHGLSVERRLPYEEALRVPLLVRYPKAVPAGLVVDPMVASVDMAPTLLEIAGVEVARQLDGRSLLPLLRGQTPEGWRTSLLIEYSTDTVFPRVKNMGYKAVRTERWKYIRYDELDGMDELYDLKTDPYEMHNLIDRPMGKRVMPELQAELDRLLQK